MGMSWAEGWSPVTLKGIVNKVTDRSNAKKQTCYKFFGSMVYFWTKIFERHQKFRLRFFFFFKPCYALLATFLKMLEQMNDTQSNIQNSNIPEFVKKLFG